MALTRPTQAPRGPRPARAEAISRRTGSWLGCAAILIWCSCVSQCRTCLAVRDRSVVRPEPYARQDGLPRPSSKDRLIENQVVAFTLTAMKAWIDEARRVGVGGGRVAPPQPPVRVRGGSGDAKISWSPNRSAIRLVTGTDRTLTVIRGW